MFYKILVVSFNTHYFRLVINFMFSVLLINDYTKSSYLSLSLSVTNDGITERNRSSVGVKERRVCCSCAASFDLFFLLPSLHSRCSRRMFVIPSSLVHSRSFVFFDLSINQTRASVSKIHSQSSSDLPTRLYLCQILPEEHRLNHPQ